VIATECPISEAPRAVRTRPFENSYGVGEIEWSGHDSPRRTLGQDVHILPLPSPSLDRLADRSGVAVLLRRVEVSVPVLERFEDHVGALAAEVGGA
jgi:hypothetical protein